MNQNRAFFFVHMIAEIKIIGRVQGVSYRYYTQSKANKLDLKGYVKNQTNGSKIHVVGQSKQIRKLIDWCRNGSPASQVNEMIISYPNETFYQVEDRFVIKR